MSRKIGLIRQFGLFRKKLNIFIQGEFRKRTHCPTIETLALLFLVVKTTRKIIKNNPKTPKFSNNPKKSQEFQKIIKNLKNLRKKSYKAKNSEKHSEISKTSKISKKKLKILYQKI